MKLIKNILKKIIKASVSGSDPFQVGNTQDIFIKVYYKNPVENNFDDVFKEGYSLELELCYFEKQLSSGFKITNLGDDLVSSTENCYYFRFSNIETVEEHRNIGVCSYLLLKAILVLIEAKPDKNFEFSLVNTVSIDINDKYKIYHRILKNRGKKNNPNMQYKLFRIENRETDVYFLKGMLKDKETSIRRGVQIADNN